MAKTRSHMVPTVVQNNLHECLYGSRWCLQATVGTASCASAPEGANASGWRSIGGIVVEIWQKQDLIWFQQWYKTTYMSACMALAGAYRPQSVLHRVHLHQRERTQVVGGP